MPAWENLRPKAKCSSPAGGRRGPFRMGRIRAGRQTGGGWRSWMKSARDSSTFRKTCGLTSTYLLNSRPLCNRATPSRAERSIDEPSQPLGVPLPRFPQGPSLLSPVPTPGLRRSSVVGKRWNVGHMCWPSDNPGVDRVPTAAVPSEPAEGSIASRP